MNSFHTDSPVLPKKADRTHGGGKRQPTQQPPPKHSWTQRLRDNALSLVLVGLFLLFLGGQSVAGFYNFNEEQRDHNEPPVSYLHYLTTGSFIESVGENWESEFLQMFAYVLFTVFLVQKGSSESKDPDKDEAVDEDPRSKADDPDAPWPVRKGGWVLKLYENSLALAFLLLFLGSLLLHALGGGAEYNAEQIAHGQHPIALLAYLLTPRFWFESLQNWQSEFLAIASMVILTIFLRQRGSPESKPVASPHHATGE